MRKIAFASLVVGVLTLTPGCPDGAGNDAGSAADAGDGDGDTGDGDGDGDGDTGDGDGGGDGDGNARSYCQDGCTDDIDCYAGYVCNDDKLCAPETCVSDAQCTADSSGWALLGACTSDNDCFGGAAGFVCVDLDGDGPGTSGGCAQGNAGDCFGAMMPVDALDMSGYSVSVCGYPATCEANGLCDYNAFACTGDGECSTYGTIGATHCVSGTCGCVSDDDCTGAMNAAGPKCVLGQCGCGTDADCDGNGLGTVCFVETGRCSCNTEADGCGSDQTCAPAQLPN